MRTNSTDAPHPFVRRPHRTLLAMAWPVLLAQAAEPIVGLVDTAFVSRLGADALAALGVGTAALSSVFWVFNFLSIGAQTKTAQATGANDDKRARDIAAITLVLAAGIGLLLIALIWPVLDGLTRAMGATGQMHEPAVTYMRIRLFGSPAVLLALGAFGVLRGLQDMRSPLYVAVSINLLNAALDAILIVGLGPFPAWGVAGAAIASTISQWLGALWAVGLVIRRLGLPRRLALGEIGGMFLIGRDLFIRTGLLTLFLLLCTRAATRLGADSGAAHQGVRQAWVFAALFLDAFAITGQSLIGFFFGASSIPQARSVAKLVCLWTLGTGMVLAVGMLLSIPQAQWMLVPPSSAAQFTSAWVICAVTMPLSALAFATDGIHWGSGDFPYLRNGVIVATSLASAVLVVLERSGSLTLDRIWWLLAVWVGLRAFWGLVRIYPGVGQSPLRLKPGDPDLPS